MNRTPLEFKIEEIREWSNQMNSTTPRVVLAMCDRIEDLEQGMKLLLELVKKQRDELDTLRKCEQSGLQENY